MGENQIHLERFEPKQLIAIGPDEQANPALSCFLPGANLNLMRFMLLSSVSPQRQFVRIFRRNDGRPLIELQFTHPASAKCYPGWLQTLLARHRRAAPVQSCRNSQCYPEIPPICTVPDLSADLKVAANHVGPLHACINCNGVELHASKA